MVLPITRNKNPLTTIVLLLLRIKCQRKVNKGYIRCTFSFMSAIGIDTY